MVMVMAKRPCNCTFTRTCYLPTYLTHPYFPDFCRTYIHTYIQSMYIPEFNARTYITVPSNLLPPSHLSIIIYQHHHHHNCFFFFWKNKKTLPIFHYSMSNFSQKDAPFKFTLRSSLIPNLSFSSHIHPN